MTEKGVAGNVNFRGHGETSHGRPIWKSAIQQVGKPAPRGTVPDTPRLFATPRWLARARRARMLAAN